MVSFRMKEVFHTSINLYINTLVKLRACHFIIVALVGTSWANSRNTTLDYVARTIHKDPPIEVAHRLGFQLPSSLTERFVPVPDDWLSGREWTPCHFDDAITDGIASERRLVYDDGPTAIWVRGEPCGGGISKIRAPNPLNIS